MKAGIIGAGRVGGCLAEYFYDAGILSGVTASSAAKTQALAQRYKLSCRDNKELAQSSDVIFITVPDRKIADVAAKLAASCKDKLKGKTVLHCSGSLGLEPLETLRSRGAHTGSLHPLQSFAGGMTVLQGVYMAVDGDEKALADAQKIAALLKGISFCVPAEERAAYHAAACFCSNYVVAAAALAQNLMCRWTNDKAAAWQALLPLFNGTAANLQQVKTAETALTGPIARGDYATVEKHLTALPKAYLDVYRSLGRETAHLASINGTIDDEIAARIELLLQNSEV